jgi:sigma-B regulation protein RsbU (phosphoserine phosphatase)
MKTSVDVGAGFKPAPALPRILVADDQSAVLEALRLLLRLEGFDIETAASPAAVLSIVDTRPIDLVLADLNYERDTTSGAEGLDLLTRLHALRPSLPVVVMTAWGSIDLAVEAMRRGAVDFVTKPWQNDQLVTTLRACLSRTHATLVSPTLTTAGQKDLWVAHGVQQRLLPQQMPRLATLSCAARCEESSAVGGDFYDFLELAPGRLGLVIADVSGKGVPAAIVMAHLCAALRSLAPEMQHDLAGLTRRLNTLLLTATAGRHYVTLFLAVYDEARQTLRYANCGHLPPALLRAGGQVEWLQPTGPVVGLLEAFTSQPQETTFGVGDTLVAYTDGLTETRDRADEEFGTERVLASLQEGTDVTAETLVARILDARRSFAAGDERDDVTVLVARGMATAMVDSMATRRCE